MDSTFQSLGKGLWMEIMVYLDPDTEPTQVPDYSKKTTP